MGLRINQNIAALNAHRNLVATDNALSKSLERLSSGFRINRAADDAAGLAISEKLRAQVRGLAQAIRNAQDGISMIQTAEGALNEVHSMLQRMRELVVQAGNGTVSADDRQAIQVEINELISELNRISDTTRFNDLVLLGRQRRNCQPFGERGREWDDRRGPFSGSGCHRVGSGRRRRDDVHGTG
jgi:flagellin